jgi:DNA-binding Xre family transcriptional regulator
MSTEPAHAPDITGAQETQPPPDSLSPMLVTRIWHIADLRNMSEAEIHTKTGIPMDMLFRLYTGDAELTADQLIRFCQALDVHPLAIFDGIFDRSGIIPHQLTDHGVARLAARLHALPVCGREMVMSKVQEALKNG